MADSSLDGQVGLVSLRKNHWGAVLMSAVTEDVIPKRKPRKKRGKGIAALRKIRRALARKKLEEMHEEQVLKENIYDVFADDDDGPLNI